MVKVIELPAATLVLIEVQLVKLVEDNSTFVFPTVKPVASNKNWPPVRRGDSRVMTGVALGTLTMIVPVPMSSWSR